MPATGKPGERPPLPRHPQAVLLPPPALRPSQRGRLLVTVWLGGLLSATGIGVLRDGFHSLVSDGGALVGVVLLIVLGLCVVARCWPCS